VGQTLLILAQAADGGGSIKMLGFIVLMFAVFYFVMIRPQSKQVKEHRTLLSGLKKGDDVITQSGLYGKIYSITDKTVILEIANNVRVRVLKSSIQGLTNLSDESSAATTAKAEEKKEEK
jgi:preprotein translocase subunit YajC